METDFTFFVPRLDSKTAPIWGGEKAGIESPPFEGVTTALLRFRSPSEITSNQSARDPLIDPLMRQIQVWRERETSQVEVKWLKKAAFLKRETSVALASYHYGTEGMRAEEVQPGTWKFVSAL